MVRRIEALPLQARWAGSVALGRMNAENIAAAACVGTPSSGQSKTEIPV
jgi:hypothetical protein